MPPASRSSLTSPVIVGRDAELGLVADALARIADGEPRIVVIGGEAGIGKTRLIEEALARAADRVGTARGECFALGSGIPYLPFVEMLRGLVRTLPPEALATVIGPARAELGRIMPELAPAPGAQPVVTDRVESAGDLERLRLYEALLRVAERITAHQPTAFVLEDVQWIDRASLELLAFLTHGLQRGSRAALIVSVRNAELEARPAVKTLLADLAHNPATQHIDLEPLSADDVRDQVTAMVGERVEDAMASRIHHLSDGNPLFAEELVAALEPRGGQSTRQAATLPDSLTPKLRDLLTARLRRLQDSTMAVLRVAAAAGRSLDEELLAAASGMQAGTVEVALRAAVEDGILVRIGGTPLGGDVGRTSDTRAGGRIPRAGYRFRHELLRTIVASQLLPTESARVHAAFARALTDAPADRRSASEIAYHWDAAGEADQALLAHLEAGRTAGASFAFGQAHAHYERALALWSMVPAGPSAEGSRSEVTARAATAAAKAGDFDRAIELARIVIAANAEGDRDLLEMSRSGLRWYLWESGRMAEARTEAEAAVAASEAMADRWHANALAHLAGLLLYERRLPEARARASAALELAQTVEAVDEEILAAGVMGWCLLLDGDVDGGLAGIQRAVEQARTVDGEVDQRRYPVGLALAHAQFAAALELAGRLDQARMVALDGMEVARRQGVERTYGAILEAAAARAAYQLGEWDEAARIVEESIAGGAVGTGRMALLTVRALLWLGRGRSESAAAAIADAGSHIDATTPPDIRRWLLVASAELALWQARPMEALTLLAGAGAEDEAPVIIRAGLQPSMVDASAPRLVSLAARACADLALLERGTGPGARMSEAAAERVRGSLRRLERQRPLREAWRAELETTHAELVRSTVGGFAKGREGRSTVRRWKLAVEACAGRPYLQAYAWWRLAEAQLGRRDGREQAARSIAAGLEISRRLGAVLIGDELLGLTRRAGMREQPGPDATSIVPSRVVRPFGLTAREIEVLALLAEGMSNSEIGERLFISPKTASVHISNIYGKLGVESRVAAASTAHSLGLLGWSEQDESGGR